MKNVFWRNVNTHKKEVLEALETISNHPELIVFDTETTGLEEDAKIIQFSAVRYRFNQEGLTDASVPLMDELDNINIYINPREIITKEITDITGIDNEMLRNEPDERAAAPEIFAFMEKAELWMSYNKDFDLTKLYHMARRTGHDYQPRRTVDVLDMARNVCIMPDIKNHKLATVTEYLLPEHDARFHDSLEDVRATAVCFTSLLKKYMEYPEEQERTQKDRLKYAYFFANPNNPGQRRVNLVMESGNRQIYWDSKNKYWSCKSETGAKKYFKTLDMADMERQVLGRYGRKYKASSMEDLSRNMETEKREHSKAQSALEDEIILQGNKNMEAMQKAGSSGMASAKDAKKQELSENMETDLELF